MLERPLKNDAFVVVYCRTDLSTVYQAAYTKKLVWIRQDDHFNSV